MKKIFTKALAVLLLLISAVFGNLVITQSFSQNVYADEIAEPAPAAPAPNPTQPPADDLPDVNDGSTDDSDSPESPDTPSDEAEDKDGEEGNTEDEEAVPVCQQESGSLSWIVCPTTELITNITDSIYKAIEQLLIVQPLSTADDSPIYLIWQYVRSITNIVFVILLIIVIYSQITGLGISNYGVKRILPRLIITVVLINLSYLICTLAVDLSNIIGFSLRDTLHSIQENVISASSGVLDGDLSIASVVGTLLSGGVVASVTISALGGIGWLFYMLLVILVGAVVAVITGLLTIAARQALVALLIMIAPLAIAAYLLPNTEKWFTKWKDLLVRMLVFYPLFSFLFGASELAGWALIASSTNALGIILGLAVQIIPLFLSFSLMKMSGTVLGTLNTGLRRALAPVQHAATGWGLSHAEHRRQLHLGYSNASGARLRRFLDYRHDLRDLETHNALEARRTRSATKVYNKAASYKGFDDEGHMTWSKHPNRITRNAKSSSYYSSLATNAQTAYNNTLGSYDRFTDKHSQRLNTLSGKAYTDYSIQMNLEKNIAEADQKFLLDQYMDAVTKSNSDPYEYNRLIRSAAGGLGHNGESAIMGQVIVNSSAIENRRRSEARIIINKFGIDKTQLRPMLFDKAHMNDNGYETDANGNVIEDDMYRLIEFDKNGKPTGFKREKWQYYLGVHKTTGKEITKAEYDTLSDNDRQAYRKVRYFDIKNDDGQLVQRVFEDDAGYMKEILRDDIAIADPINRRYLTEIGVAHADGETTGQLRRYHSTIKAAMIESHYKDHAAGVTPMSASQADRGFITSKGQWNIAELQSLTAAGKAGSFLKNDGIIVNEMVGFMQAINDDAKFAKYFPDEDIMNYRNVNGVHLDGWRLATDSNGNQYWQEINHNDPTITLEDKKNLVRHKILPKAAAKIIGMMNRNISPGVQDDMKPDGLKALEKMVEALGGIAIDNATNQKLGQEPLAEGDINIFDSNDPGILKRSIQKLQYRLDQVKQQQDFGDDNNDGDTPPGSSSPNSPNGNSPKGGNGGNSGSKNDGGNSKPNNGGPKAHTHPGVNQFRKRRARSDEAHQLYIQRNSYETIMENIISIFEFDANYDSVSEQLLDYFNGTESLRTLIDDCQYLINQYRFDERSSSITEAIHDMSHYQDIEQDHIGQLHDAIIDLINNRAKTY